MLTIWEKYGYTPHQWKQINRQAKMDLLAKLVLDNEREERIQKEMDDD